MSEIPSNSAPIPPRIPGLACQAYYNTHPGVPELGMTFLHCGRCLTELQASLHRDMSPRDYARTQIAITADGGLQVWCSRHACNVALISFRAVDERPECTCDGGPQGEGLVSYPHEPHCALCGKE